MNRFAAFNVVFTIAVAIALAAVLRSRRELRVTLQVAVYVTALAYPWDFFAITLGAWTYGDPGPRLFGVPINDLIFIFGASALSAGVFVRAILRRDANAEPKHRGDKSPHREVDCSMTDEM